jgi:uncharacterized membrane protein
MSGARCRRVFRETGKLLVVFIVGSCATIIGTLVAARVFPLTMLGADGWKVSHVSLYMWDSNGRREVQAPLSHADVPQVASALAARHIGGAVNYVAGAKLLADALRGQCNIYMHPNVRELLTCLLCNALQWLKQPA